MIKEGVTWMCESFLKTVFKLNSKINTKKNSFFADQKSFHEFILFGNIK